MKIRNLLLPLLLCGASLFLHSCKEKSYIYEVNELEVSPNNSDKNKEKTVEQYVAILYANMFQQALSPDQQVDLADLIASIGDKQIAFEAITAKMITDPDIQLPSNEEMRTDVSSFVTDTYRRFFVRNPTEAEKEYFINYIESRPNVTPVHIYFSFATSNEYYYY